MNHSEAFPVTVILSISSLIFPVIFGGIIWKLSRIFVGKEEFTAHKVQIKEDHAELKMQIEGVKQNTIKLLERTAHLRNPHDETGN